MSTQLGLAMSKTWVLFKDLLVNPLRRKWVPKTYQFKYVEPKVNLRFQYRDLNEWKSHKQRWQMYDHGFLLACGVFGFILGQFYYSFTHNKMDDYHYHRNYPIPSRAFDAILSDLHDLANPFNQIMPKDKYDYSQFLPKLYEFFRQKQKSIAESDAKMFKVREEMKEFDAKFTKSE